MGAAIIILAVMSVVIVSLVYVQSGNVKSIGASIMGTQNIELFEHKKRRGSEKILHIITMVLIFSFIVIAFTLLFF